MASNCLANAGAIILTILLAACGSASDAGSGNSGQQTASSSASVPVDGGKLQFLQCSACHEIRAGAPPKIGPNLHCVIGRKAGSQPSFTYSPAFRQAAAQGLVWTRENLMNYLEKPSKFIPDNAMGFGGIASARDREALLDYLARSCSQEDH